MLDLLRDILGSPPVGYEYLEYVVAAIFLLLVVKIVIDVFFSIFKLVVKW